MGQLVTPIGFRFAARLSLSKISRSIAISRADHRENAKIPSPSPPCFHRFALIFVFEIRGRMKPELQNTSPPYMCVCVCMQLLVLITQNSLTLVSYPLTGILLRHSRRQVPRIAMSLFSSTGPRDEVVVVVCGGSTSAFV